MRRIAVVWMAIFLCGSIFAQTAKIPVDTIVRLGGKKVPCKIVNVSSSTIVYSLPGKTESLAVDRKEVEKVIYKNGRVDVFNKPVVTMIEEGQWEGVLVTEDKKDVQGLYNRGTISAQSSPSSNKKKSKQSAIIKLQKKAANLKGSYILLTKVEPKGGYGDVPGYVIEAIVYGTEPLEEGTNVVNDGKSKVPPKK